jgi:hypothetical protein
MRYGDRFRCDGTCKLRLLLQFVSLVGKHSHHKCVRTIPLPSNANHIGPILYHPENDFAKHLLTQLGTPVCCQKEEEMLPLIAVTGHISPFYLFLSCCEQYLKDSGKAVM